MARNKKPEQVTPRANSNTGATSLDVEALRQIVEILESSEVTSLAWSNGKEKVSIRRGAPQVTQVVQHVAAPATPGVSLVAPSAQGASAHHAVELKPRPTAPAARTAVEAAEKKGHIITSPFVGTFYRSPAPDQPSFVEVGSTVKKGQVLCIVEAMKLMNEIESEVAGKVAEVLTQNAQPVEFGQPLFRVEPA
jgi:acetyl-CoA carboxylase biotin carboxyl carrier protein